MSRNNATKTAIHQTEPPAPRLHKDRDRIIQILRSLTPEEQADLLGWKVDRGRDLVNDKPARRVVSQWTVDTENQEQ